MVFPWRARRVTGIDFQGAYKSGWHHPGIAWISNGIFLLVGLRRAPEHWRLYLFLVALGGLLDAWFTGALSPLPGSTATAIVFVIAGDWRYFYVVDRRVLISLAVSFVVPLVQTALLPLLTGRWVFACYEALFLVIASLYRRDRLLTPFVQAYYALWLIADLLLISGAEWALSLRLCANLLYYGAFVWYVSWCLQRSPHATTNRR